MALVSISEAIRLSGRSRQYFYENYINNNLLSVDRSEKRRPKIDTSDLLRFFPELKSDNKDKTQKQSSRTSIDTPEKDKRQIEYSLSVREELAKVKAENEGLKALLQSKEDHIKLNSGQIEREVQNTDEARQRALNAENQYKALLEDKREKDQLTQRLSDQLETLQQKRWWQFW